MIRRFQLKRVGKAILTCIITINLLCFGTLYTLYSEGQNNNSGDGLPVHMKKERAAGGGGEGGAGARGGEERGGWGVKAGGHHVNEASKKKSISVFESPCPELDKPPTIASDSVDDWQPVVNGGT